MPHFSKSQPGIKMRAIVRARLKASRNRNRYTHARNTTRFFLHVIVPTNTGVLYPQHLFPMQKKAGRCRYTGVRSACTCARKKK